MIAIKPCSTKVLTLDRFICKVEHKLKRARNAKSEAECSVWRKWEAWEEKRYKFITVSPKTKPQFNFSPRHDYVSAFCNCRLQRAPLHETILARSASEQQCSPIGRNTSVQCSLPRCNWNLSPEATAVISLVANVMECFAFCLLEKLLHRLRSCGVSK